MISRITSHLFLGEFSDVILENGKLNIDAMKSFEITAILNVMEVNDKRECHAILEAALQYVWSPVPVDCTDCDKYKMILGRKMSYDPQFCDDCPNNVNNMVPSKKSKFIKGLEIAVRNLESILRDHPNERVLVHCTAGIDRSPFVVAKYLADNGKIIPVLSKEKDKAFDFIKIDDLHKAYALISRMRPQIYEHYEWNW